MNTKWYFGALIVILALFGVSQERLMLPNQEIVLQFSGDEVSSNQVNLAISNVKKQLETIGVSKVEISEQANGRLVISYYSDANIANVKSVLANKTTIALNYTSTKNSDLPQFPKDNSYNFDVFEISKSSDTGFGSTSKLFFELKQDYDRFSNPNFNVYAAEFNASEKNIEVLVAYKLNKTIAIAINNIPHKIPEGRAGPLF